MIPDFDPGGNLPPGIHVCEWEEFVARYGWNERRRHLLSGLKRALDALKRAHCERAYIDGSFVTTKDQPGDFDACWDPVGVVAVLLDPVLLRFENQRQLQKIKYFGEMFPSTGRADAAGRLFLEFFQKDKNTDEPKGIVLINLRGLP